MASGRITYGKPIRYYVEGREVTRAEFDKAFPGHPVKGDNVANVLHEKSTAWPRLSDALGVGAKQKDQAESMMKKLGVPTEYAPDGCGAWSAVIRSNQHQREVLKVLKMRNLDAGYNQVTG